MKKWIVIFSIIVGILLTACAKTQGEKELETTSAAEITAEEETVAPAENEAKEAADNTTDEVSEDVSKDSVMEEKEVTLLHLSKDCKNVTYKDLETYEYYMEYSDEKIILSEEDAVKYPALAATLEAERNKRNASYQSELDVLLAANKEEKENGRDVGYESCSTLSVVRADSVVLSICDFVSDYTGGAHGNYCFYGYNYDTKTGKLLEFSDVVSDPVAFLKLADEKIHENYREDTEVPSSLDDFFEDYDTSIIWTIDYQGVRLYFNPYTLGSYALGEIETEIYFNEAPELFHAEYLNIPKSYVMELLKLEPSFPDINQDGQNEEIIISSTYDEEYGYAMGADITVTGKKFHVDEDVEQGYFVTDRGKNYILLSLVSEGDYKVISTIDLPFENAESRRDTEGFLAVYNRNQKYEGERDEYNCTKAVFTDPSKVMLSTYIQYLGTMTGYGYYHMGEDAGLVADTRIYNIDTESVITANMDVNCEQVDLDGKVLGETVIPKGTKLVVRRGDGATFADLIEVPANADVSENEYYEYLNSELKLEDADIIYRVRGEQSQGGFQTIINGLEEYRVFAKILYAD